MRMERNYFKRIKQKRQRKRMEKRGRKTQRRFGGSDSSIEENEGLERRGCASIIKGKHIQREWRRVLRDFVRFSVNFLVPLTDHSIRRCFQTSWAISRPPFGSSAPKPYPPVRVSNPSSEVAWYNIQLHSCK